jgi:hypothetical protein
MKKQKLKFQLLTFSLVIYTLVFTPIIKATELVITENGSGSQSEVVVEQDTETQVTQTNEASVENDIQIDVNTGENEVSDNTGSEAEITTGETSTEITVNNELNSSVVDSASCCDVEGLEVTIAENGADSQNEVDIKNTSDINIVVTQTAGITNTISGTINTGGNTANDNTSSSVSISTGDIKGEVVVNNGPVNVADVSANSGTGSEGNVNIKIDNNGSGTNNTIKVNFDNNNDVFINHSSDVENFFVWDLNTGDNEANGNTDADVSIETGNIDFEIFVNNFLNLDSVKVDTCCNISSHDTPYDPGDEYDDPGNGEEESGDQDSTSSSSSDDSSGSISAGDEAQAGGPGILGLSDTSSEKAQILFFWLGLALFTFGGRLTIKELSSDSSKR